MYEYEILETLRAIQKDLAATRAERDAAAEDATRPLTPDEIREGVRKNGAGFIRENSARIFPARQ